MRKLMPLRPVTPIHAVFINSRPTICCVHGSAKCSFRNYPQGVGGGNTFCPRDGERLP